MKRRIFLGTYAATAAATAAAISTTGGCKIEKINTFRKDQSVTNIDKLGEMTLEELREQYRYNLFDDYLPFLNKYVIDHEYGGFMCNTDRDGTNITKNKRDPSAYLIAYNACDGKTNVTDIARLINVTQAPLTTILKDWENFGIVYPIDTTRGKNYVGIYKINISKEEIKDIKITEDKQEQNNNTE